MNHIPENAADQASAPSVEPTPAKTPRVGAHARHVRVRQGKSAKQAGLAKKAHKATKSAKSRKRTTASRKGSKTARFLDLLKRSGGATSADLMKATGWQAHSVRGFISGVLGRKMGLKVTSTRVEDGERRYLLKS